MGAKSFVALTVLIAGIGIAIVYLSPHVAYVQVVKFLEYSTLDYFRSSSEPQSIPSGERIFTVDELSKYDGSGSSPGLYLAILGKVFDVEKGAQHYRPGGGYSFFAGRDATRAYVTGDFSDQGLVDNIDGLESSALLGIDDWLHFYEEEYIYVGKLIGRYYDKNGNPTEEYKSTRQAIEQAKQDKVNSDKEKKLFPPCNSEWSREKGTRVWCTNKSGGVERDWVGVPRKLFKPGQQERCACVKDSGSPSGSSKNIDDRGDLDNPNLKVYANCAPDSTSCSWKD
ncbi:neuferricin [Centruroides vittatus]|uniref:neuferricin n=1 Tax=Centruroides vittatus TaxID=120091 RepID=UPI00350EB533